MNTEELYSDDDKPIIELCIFDPHKCVLTPDQEQTLFDQFVQYIPKINGTVEQMSSQKCGCHVFFHIFPQHLITLRCRFSRSASFILASQLEIVSTSWQKRIRILMHNSNNTNVFCQCDQLKSRPLSIQVHPGTSNAARRQVRYTTYRTYILKGLQAGTDFSFHRQVSKIPSSSTSDCGLYAMIA